MEGTSGSEAKAVDGEAGVCRSTLSSPGREGEKTAKMPRRWQGGGETEPCWRMYASGSRWNPLP